MSRERRTLEGMVPRTDGVRLRDRVRRDGAVKAGRKGQSLSLPPGQMIDNEGGLPQSLKLKECRTPETSQR